MNFVIAMDSFKDCASSLEIGTAIKEGILEVFPQSDINIIPIADGGEGTVDTLISGLCGEIKNIDVRDPLGNKINAQYGLLPDGTAVIEMAKASGLELVPYNKRNPMNTSSFGTGQLIAHALQEGSRKFIIGIGGSATNDAGMGMLIALGVEFLDASGQVLQGIGSDLLKIDKINTTNIDPLIQESEFQIACDVNNPLFGKNGAAYIYGPQKGATPEIVFQLDLGLQNFAEKTKQYLLKDIDKLSGAGAAGGLGAALVAFLDAELHPGIDIILDYLNIEQYIHNTDIVFVGEGRLDKQTGMGKAPAGVASRVKKIKDIPVIALGGGIQGDPSILHSIGISAYFSIVPGPISLEEALKKENTLMFVKRQSREICYLIKSVC